MDESSFILLLNQWSNHTWNTQILFGAQINKMISKSLKKKKQLPNW